MKRRLSFALLVIVATFFGPAAASDLVDFGDSGIVVVVEASGKESGVIYIPSVPDEFYTFYPALPAAPSVPYPGAGRPEPNLPDPCERAIANLNDIEQEIVWRQETINWANKNGYIYDALNDGSQIWAGSARFQEIIDHLNGEIEDLREARDDAADAVKEHCGPPAQS